MNALLIVSHGSRRAQSNSEITDLTDKVRPLLKGNFQFVCTAFLELAEPSIPEGIAHCINQGAERILLLPYFLAAGRHVSVDIPAIVEKARVKYPSLSINIADHIGGSDLMAEFVARSASQSF